MPLYYFFHKVFCCIHNTLSYTSSLSYTQFLITGKDKGSYELIEISGEQRTYMLHLVCIQLLKYKWNRHTSFANLNRSSYSSPGNSVVGKWHRILARLTHTRSNTLSLVSRYACTAKKNPQNIKVPCRISSPIFFYVQTCSVYSCSVINRGLSYKLSFFLSEKCS